MTYPASSTPVPSVHRAPGSSLNQLAFTEQQLAAIGQQLLSAFLRQVAISLLGVSGANTLAAIQAQLSAWSNEIQTDINGALGNWTTLITDLETGDFPGLVTFFENQVAQLQHMGITGLYDATAGFNNLSTSLLKYLTPTGGDIGQFDAGGLSGALNGAVTFGGTALSTLLQYLNSSGQFAASQLTGGLNTAVTFGGTALSSFFQNINGSGQLLASGLTGALNIGVTFSGTALSTLLQNLNSSGQFAASQLTGGLNTGVTVAGTGIGTLLSNINSTGQFLGSAITGAINTAATVSGQTIGTIQANAQGVVNGINNAAAGLLSGGSTLLADAETNIANLFASAPAYLQGLSGISGQAATNNAYAAVAAQAAAQASQIAQQQSAFNAVFNVSPSTAGNVNVTVDFTGVANQSGMSGIMLPGTGSGSGHMGVTSGAAAWQGGTGDDIEVFPTQTVSDYQVVDITLGNLNDLLSGGGSTAVPFRVNSARTICCRIILLALGGIPYIWLDAVVSGTETVLSASASGALSSIASGGRIRVIAGDPSSASPYAFQVLYNSTPIITYTDSSHVSQIGPGQRYVALENIVTTSGKFPPAIRSVTYQDNPPLPSSYPYSGLPTAGTKGREYWPNDVGLALRDNGSAWETIWGGELSAFTPPAAFGSTAGSGGTFSSDKGSRLLNIVTTGSFNWCFEYKAISPASNYICRAYFECLPFWNNDAFQAPSIILYDSVSGKLISWGYGYDPSTFRMQANKWNSISSFNAAYVNNQVADVMGYGIHWWQIRDDGSNRYFEYSYNGVDFYTAGTSSRTDFITPTHIGWGAGSSTVTPFGHRLRSWTNG